MPAAQGPALTPLVPACLKLGDGATVKALHYPDFRRIAGAMLTELSLNLVRDTGERKLGDCV